MINEIITFKSKATNKTVKIVSEYEDTEPVKLNDLIDLFYDFVLGCGFSLSNKRLLEELLEIEENRNPEEGEW